MGWICDITKNDTKTPFYHCSLVLPPAPCEAHAPLLSVRPPVTSCGLLNPPPRDFARRHRRRSLPSFLPRMRPTKSSMSDTSHASEKLCQ